MKVRKRVKKPGGRSGVGRNVLRTDPSRTTTLRRAFAAALRKKFAILKGRVVRLVDDEDALGLRPPSRFATNVFCPTGPGGGVDPSCEKGGSSSHDSRIHSPEFKAWFGDWENDAANASKATDDDGTPMVVYHATDQGFASFDPKAQRKFPGLSFGFHFSSSEAEAKAYGGVMVRAYLKVTNPLAVSSGDQEPTAYLDADRAELIHKVVQSRRAGKPYDGVIVTDNKGRKGFVVFEPTQIKSADNRGTFDPNDPHIRNQRPTANAWRGPDADKVKAFQSWLRTQIDEAGLSDEELWLRYAEAGFRKGAGRAFDDVGKKRKGAPPQSPSFALGARDHFLRTSLGRPVAVEKVKLLAGRAFDELKGVTADMGLRMSRVLTDGLVRGESPRTIARTLADEVDIGRGRAEAVARTEIIRVHAEGQLEALEQLDVEEVGVAVEWLTAEGACPECAAMEGVVLKVGEAHGVLPRHRNCKCAFAPANVGEDGGGRKDTKAAIDRAVKQSQSVGGGDDWEPAQDISKARPRSIFNAAPLAPSLLAFSRFLSANADLSGGHWVTLGDDSNNPGQHVFIGGDGKVYPSGPGTEPAGKSGKEGAGKAPRLGPKPQPRLKPGERHMPGAHIAERIRTYKEADHHVERLTKIHDEPEKANAEWNAAADRRKALRKEFDAAQDKMYAEVGATGAASKETVKAMNAADRKFKAADKEAKAAADRLTEALDKSREEYGKVFEELKASDPLEVRMTKVNATPNVERNADSAHAWLMPMVERGDAGTLPTLYVQNTNTGRAHFSGLSHGYTTNGIYLSDSNIDSVHVHEMGHYLENNLPGVQKAAQEFLAHRVGSEPLRKLREVTGNAMYDDWEQGRKDDFGKSFTYGANSGWYAGKHYSSGDTEIVSMGLEELHRNPARFAAKDPEYFKFIHGILKGHLR